MEHAAYLLADKIGDVKKSTDFLTSIIQDDYLVLVNQLDDGADRRVGQTHNGMSAIKIPTKFFADNTGNV